MCGATCGASTPYGRNLVVPAGSIYAAPAAEIQRLGYRLAHVDTIIGYIEAHRFRGGPGNIADRLVVDIYTRVSSGRRVVSAAAQTLEGALTGVGLSAIVGEPTTPSLDVRQDAVELLATLGCEHVETEQRMGPDGLELAVWCADNRAEQDIP